MRNKKNYRLHYAGKPKYYRLLVWLGLTVLIIILSTVTLLTEKMKFF